MSRHHDTVEEFTDYKKSFFSSSHLRFETGRVLAHSNVFWIDPSLKPKKSMP